MYRSLKTSLRITKMFLKISLRHKNENKKEFDIGRKVLEDPLSVLKQKEHEKFQQLKANPQKMARLQKLMNAYLGQDDSPSSDDDRSTKRYSRAPVRGHLLINPENSYPKFSSF